MGCIQSSKSNGNTHRESDFVSEDKTSRFKDKYKIGENLGKGAYSVVKVAINKETGEEVAVKCINRKILSDEDEKYLREEVAILKICDHPNIVKFYDFFEEEKCFYLTMERLVGGELFDRIIHKSCYTEKEARDVILLLLSAIKYCHDHGIVHRDLKPENLLLKSSENDTDIKLVDFGFAANNECKDVLKTQCGSPGYCAPEILKNEQYTSAVDMWSIGVILYILICGYPPFREISPRLLNKKVRNGDYEFDTGGWFGVSEDVKDLIRQLLTVQPELRITAEMALKHPWIITSNEELQSRSLDNNIGALKTFVCNRRFRKAAYAVTAITRLQRLLRNKPDLIPNNECGICDMSDDVEEGNGVYHVPVPQSYSLPSPSMAPINRIEKLTTVGSPLKENIDMKESVREQYVIEEKEREDEYEREREKEKDIDIDIKEANNTERVKEIERERVRDVEETERPEEREREKEM